MSADSNEQILKEIAMIKQEIRQLRETVAQYHIVQTAHPHIIRIAGVQGGEPIVRNAYVTVRTIVEQIRLGATPEELVEGYPPLTLAQIHDALSYYYDPTEEIDHLIAEHKQTLDQSPQIAASKPGTTATYAFDTR